MSTHFASSVTELEDAIQAANEGDTIYLAPGVYDGITIEAAHFSSPITIRSLDPENRAILTVKTDVSSCSCINFE